MTRNSTFFRRRPLSLLQTWLGKRKAPKASAKITNSLSKHRNIKLSGTKIYK